MKLLTLSALALLLLTGCGATYTKLERPKTAESAKTGETGCPNGINYKTGHCR